MFGMNNGSNVASGSEQKKLSREERLCKNLDSKTYGNWHKFILRNFRNFYWFYFTNFTYFMRSKKCVSVCVWGGEGERGGWWCAAVDEESILPLIPLLVHTSSRPILVFCQIWCISALPVFSPTRKTPALQAKSDEELLWVGGVRLVKVAPYSFMTAHELVNYNLAGN